jgi:hypothetical protein
MLKFAFLLATALAVQPVAKDNVGLHQTTRRVVQYTSRLRFCNAYVPEDGPGEVNLFLVGTGKDAANPSKKMINKKPIAFPSCIEDNRVLLMEGDRFEITVGSSENELAEFIVTDFNKANDPLLTLVLARKSAASREPHFISHQYAPLKNSQIAVMDLYLPGPVGHNMKILREKVDKVVEGNHTSVIRYEEELKPNSVMAFDSGLDYDVILTDNESGEVGKASFKAQNGGDYLALTVGMQGSKGHSKPELLFFPSGAFRPVVGILMAILAACLV